LVPFRDGGDFAAHLAGPGGGGAPAVTTPPGSEFWRGGVSAAESVGVARLSRLFIYTYTLLSRIPAMARFKLQQGNVSKGKNFQKFRNVNLIPMETSSSSDDGCDSLGSDNFANTKHSFRKGISEELAKIFSEDSDNESFCGFSECEIQDVLKIESGSEQERAENTKMPLRARTKKTMSLRVALKFPPKRSQRLNPQKDNPQKHTKPAHLDNDSEDENGSNFLEKRALNIKENKEMLAKLMAELKNIPGFLSNRNSFSAATPKVNRTPRSPMSGRPARRNPERHSRPHTRSRSLIDGPPSPSLEEEEEDDRYYLVRRRKTMDEDLEEDAYVVRRSRPSSMALPHVVRPVEEITEQELDNICYNVRGKVYNRATVSNATK
ncbi:hypothetical protein FKM82_019594, partial [Ascaphus truei]